MMADRIVHQPIHKRVVSLKQNKIPLTKLGLGFESAVQAMAYPIQLIGYPHQVRDRSIMLTYCTVCRTGRESRRLSIGRHGSFQCEVRR